MSLDRALAAMDRALGSGRVVTDPDVLEAVSHDESDVPRRRADAYVEARSEQDVQHVLRIANAHRVPVTARAGGTGRVGAAVPVAGGVVLGMTGMDQLLGLERDDQVAFVQPGMITGRFGAEAEAAGLFYPPDPNSLESCCLGGNVALDAGGPRAFKYGVTRNYVLGMRAVLADGTAVALGRRTPKGVTGYDLVGTIVGSEGTLAVITELTMKLVARPEAVGTLLAFFADDSAIARAVSALGSARLVPRCLELLDGIALELVRSDAGLDVPSGARAMLLVELDGDDAALPAAVERAGSALADCGALEVLVARHGGERERLWSARRKLSRTLRTVRRHKISEDVVVPRSRLADLLAHCRALADRTGLLVPTYGHAGDGNLHVNFLWDTDDEKRLVDEAVESLFRAVIGMSGTLSGEHGIGLAKAPYLGLEQAPEVIALGERVKRTFDPNGILNPGKIFPTGRRHGAC